jgi:hypothetical protein
MSMAICAASRGSAAFGSNSAQASSFTLKSASFRTKE